MREREREITGRSDKDSPVLDGHAPVEPTKTFS